jgi:hypothetical protein
MYDDSCDIPCPIRKVSRLVGMFYSGNSKGYGKGGGMHKNLLY